MKKVKIAAGIAAIVVAGFFTGVGIREILSNKAEKEILIDGEYANGENEIIDEAPIFDDITEVDEVEETGAEDDTQDEYDSKIKEITSEMKVENKFKFVTDKGSDEMSFGTPWKENKDNVSIGIDGRGIDAIEQGIGFINIKDKDGTRILALGDGGENLAPKYVEWTEDNDFLVYMVYRHGREFTNGTLYKVNPDTMEAKIVYVASEDEEVLEATEISSDILNVKMLKSNKAIEMNIKIK